MSRRAAVDLGSAAMCIALIALPLARTFGQAAVDAPKPPAAAKPATAPAANAPTTAATTPAPAPAPAASPPGTAVTTIEGERLAAAVESITAGKLTLAGTPPREIPLDEIERIEFAAGSGMALLWLGQDNYDLAKGANAAGPSGIQDIHLRVTSLPVTRTIKQVVAVCKYSEQSKIWRLDPGNAPLWRIATDYKPGAAVADLFLEPTANDSFGNEFNVTITYDDQTTTALSVKAATHATDKVKVSGTPTAPGSNALPPKVDTPPTTPKRTGPPVVVHLDAQNQLRGQLLELDGESLTLATPWRPEVKLSLLATLGFAGAGATTPEAQVRFADRLKKPATEDTALIVGADQKVAEVGGTLKSFAEGKLLFEFGSDTRKIDPARLVGVVLAAHPSPAKPGSPYQVVQLSSGDSVSGMLAGATADNFDLETAWGGKLTLPRTDVRRIDFRNGRLVHLSDVEPLSVEEVPYFGRRMGYRRDASLTGGPLKIKGTQYPKGLAVHSRCVLNYPLNGQYEKFLSQLGFDDDAGGRGAVACRVLGDGKELFTRPSLKGADPPVAVEAAVAGVKVLTLEVDFGEAEDTGDRVIWANPRLLRAAAK